MIVFRVPGDMIDQKWPLILSLLYPAIERSAGRWEPDDVLRAIRSGRLQAWIATEGGSLYGAWTTQINVYPRLRALEYVFLGGTEWHKWRDEMDRAVCAYAEEEGCTRVEMVGRKGWERAARAIGFAFAACVCEKEVHHGQRREHAADRQDNVLDGHAGLAEAGLSADH